MERETAEKLMAVLIDFEKPMNEAAALIETVSGNAEREELRRGLAEVITRTFTDLMVPIIRQYPELDPDKDSDWLRDLRARRPGPNG
jgi:hypothetical protein